MSRTRFVIATGALVLFLAAAPAAKADTFCAWHGEDVTYVHANHSSFAACDIVRVRTCEEVVGCSDWVPRDGPH
jgi:hypothetical protein